MLYTLLKVVFYGMLIYWPVLAIVMLSPRYRKSSNGGIDKIK